MVLDVPPENAACRHCGCPWPVPHLGMLGVVWEAPATIAAAWEGWAETSLGPRVRRFPPAKTVFCPVGPSTVIGPFGTSSRTG